MTVALPHITVCICTFKRPVMLRKLLDSLTQQRTNERFTLSVVVTDNDRERSAECVVTDYASEGAVAVVYRCEPRQNIALARNEAVRHASGNFIAFIDDDEFPDPDWLATMLAACERYEAAGVLGPVKPHFDEQPPRWVIDGRFCERPEHPSGRVMRWEECRTGNVLFRRRIIEGVGEVFAPQFGTGGEDKDFFMRMAAAGHVFRWCSEGVVHELVPRERWTRGYMLRRALLRGKNILRHPVGQGGLLARSAVAAPAYLLLLPFTLPFGQHVFMKYCIKLFDHGGRLLALMGFNPVRER